MNDVVKISILPPCRTVIFSLVWIWTVSASLAATEWLESVYFADAAASSTELPRPKDTWKLHSQQKFCIGKKNSSSELLHGPGEKTKKWFIGDYAIIINSDDSANIYSKDLLQEMSPIDALPEAEWTKELKPVRTLKSGDSDILVFATPERTTWIAKDSGQILAKAEGRMVTLYENSKINVPEPAPDAKEMEAINAAFKAQKKAEQYWKLPE